MQPRRGEFCFVLLLGVTTLWAGCQAPAWPSAKKDSGSRPGLLGLNRKTPGQDPLRDDSLDPMGARNPDRLLFHDLTPSQIGTTLKVRGFGKPDQALAEQAFERGQQHYREATALAEKDAAAASEEFAQAANQFRIAADRWPDSALEQDALFYQGESFFFANRYVQSNRAFEQLIAEYSGTRYLDKAEARRFAMAQYWLELSRGGAAQKFKPGDPQRPAFNLASEARRIFHRIRLDDPSGKLADDATMALGNAYFEARMYTDAADTYEDLRITYPGSPHGFHAHLFELKSRMNSYYGQSYDQEPLVKADELLKKIVTLYPDQAGAEEEYLEREATTVRNLLAERDHALGKFYERKGENLAARMIYDDVAKSYQDTSIAADSRARFAALEDKPAEPTQHGKWLVDMLPQSEASKPLIAPGDKESILR